MRDFITTQAQAVARHAEEELAALVSISSYTGDRGGAETMAAALSGLLPAEAQHRMLPSSTDGFAPDLLATLTGAGQGHLLLVGHGDTVIRADDHVPLSGSGDVRYGSGTYDMKGGLVIACGVMRALARQPELYATVELLVVFDEEGRAVPMAHHPGRDLAPADACLVFEGGERLGTVEAVVLRRKGAFSLAVQAQGRASHSGAAPSEGASALEAVARLSRRLAVDARDADDHLTVVPTLMSAGEAPNIVPATGQLACDVRAFSAQTARNALALVPDHLGDVKLTAALVQRFPPMDCREHGEVALSQAAELLGRPLLGVERGGSSDANFFAQDVPLTVDGLGPVGGADHSPREYVLASSFVPQTELALALALAALGAGG